MSPTQFNGLVELTAPSNQYPGRSENTMLSHVVSPYSSCSSPLRSNQSPRLDASNDTIAQTAFTSTACRIQRNYDSTVCYRAAVAEATSKSGVHVVDGRPPPPHHENPRNLAKPLLGTFAHDETHFCPVGARMTWPTAPSNPFPGWCAHAYDASRAPHRHLHLAGSPATVILLAASAVTSILGKNSIDMTALRVRLSLTRVAAPGVFTVARVSPTDSSFLHSVARSSANIVTIAQLADALTKAPVAQP